MCFVRSWTSGMPRCRTQLANRRWPSALAFTEVVVEDEEPSFPVPDHAELLDDLLSVRSVRRRLAEPP
jgi:hypothetical protein